MMMTEAERARWHAQMEAAHAARRKQCTEPVTPANPITPRAPGHRYGLRSDVPMPRRA